ncbi:DUF3037 domain-containing protein [Brucella pseudogrignonensis]|uniref:DUF3037 domain-containing protein n=1 Tax=Brucella pseudogrignonensis TaxID=419475 RepID=UPI000CFC1104|nr:DUF3037 domain-containing protein [Brucella pseudogrignonensis]MQP38624.1 DUF3037 domain-containing protein [Ochrobactrum sp. MYb237]PQZ43242.1 hypothetical protein CQ059_04715 [Brucella pseudogrignonensis]PRA42989.1 hypothetical protein CQ063_01200 [Brucella pseudogrignonensis]PRA72543.1 hypothetical protein CQ055_04380 [Brucella pseudogrignonensis]
MNLNRLRYSIIQFSPYPERAEYINVGVVVFSRMENDFASKIVEDFSRVKRVFGDINQTFLSFALHDFSERIAYELKKGDFSEEFIGEFNSRRADMFRLTTAFPIADGDVNRVAEKLFQELVILVPQAKRIERVNALLTDAFLSAGVLPLLDKRPEPVPIPQYGVTIQADYGYQNGVYNLIDAARFDNPQRGLAEAGKRILEGRALSEISGRRLIVVAKFGSQPESFVNKLRDDFSKADAKLFRMEEIDQLAHEIRKSAH